MANDDKTPRPAKANIVSDGDSQKSQDDMSDMLDKLKSLEQMLSNQPDIDEDRVKEIRDALSSGEFRVDPEQVATKLIDLDRESGS